ncbi:hypothetical protein SLE2022_075070 [Rubroshorea leprosula]
MIKGSVDFKPENLLPVDIPSTWRAMEALYDSGKARAIGTKGVHLSGYSPLGFPGTKWIETQVLRNPILNMVAEKVGKTPAQVAIRWGLQMGQSVVPKSTYEARIKENFDVFDGSIAQDWFAKFTEFEQGRLFGGECFVHETFGHYKTAEELWDGDV